MVWGIRELVELVVCCSTISPCLSNLVHGSAKKQPTVFVASKKNCQLNIIMKECVSKFCVLKQLI